MTEDLTEQLKALRHDDSYYPPPKPRPRIKAPWRVEWPEEFPMTIRHLDDGPNNDDAA